MDRLEYNWQLQLTPNKVDHHDKVLIISISTIAAIYKQRWQIELFFKWIKQNLKIKTFLGTSKNAVLAQLWTAMIYYLLRSYIKFMTQAGMSLTTMARRVKDGLLLRMDLMERFCLGRGTPTHPPDEQDVTQNSCSETFTGQ